ncbi:MAG: acyltransferase family protein [Deltaproteobacteria bacterium]|nr:acyltransferase family protein [Deltaproteobacteria bacterium]
MKHRLDIDGLRAVAVAFVVIYHADPGLLEGGFIGVDVFFVISGFLITKLLLGEWDRTGRIDLLDFWARRARRLLPAATAVLTITAIGAGLVLSPLRWRVVGTEILAAAGYGSNMLFGIKSVNYFADDLSSSPVLHCWSLSVEEQFYLAWPLLVLFTGACARRALTDPRRAIGLAIVVVVVVSFGLNIWMTARGSPWAFFGSPLRAWQLGSGALLATSKAQPSGGLAAALATSGLVGITAAAIFFSDATRYPGLPALLPTLSAVALIAGGSGTPVATVLGSRPFSWLGERSYSLYLWHWPVLAITREWMLSTTRAQCYLLIAISMALAALSYHWIEQPARRSQRLGSSARNSLLLGVALIGATAVVGGALRFIGLSMEGHDEVAVQHRQARTDVARVDEAVCGLLGVAETAESCRFGDRSGALRILLLGDSHAQQWIPALDALGQRHGFQVIYSGRGACPAAIVGLRRKTKRTGRHTKCDEWHAEVVARRQFDLVIITSSGFYPSDGWLIDSDGRALSADQAAEAWRVGLATLHHAWADSPRLVILDNPRFPFDPVYCLGMHEPGDCSVSIDVGTEPVRIAREADRSIAEMTGALVFDPVARLCPQGVCAPLANEVILYRDNNHLTAAAVLSMVDELGAILPK